MSYQDPTMYLIFAKWLSNPDPIRGSYEIKMIGVCRSKDYLEGELISLNRKYDTVLKLNKRLDEHMNEFCRADNEYDDRYDQDFMARYNRELTIYMNKIGLSLDDRNEYLLTTKYKFGNKDIFCYQVIEQLDANNL